MKATVNFQIDRPKCQVRIWKRKFKMVAILFFHMTPCHVVSNQTVKLIKQSLFKLETGNQIISEERKLKTSKRTDPNFESHQALVVSSYPVKFQVDWTKRL